MKIKDIKIQELTKLLEKYSKKKVTLKEYDITADEARQDAYVNMENAIEVALDNCAAKFIDEIENFKSNYGGISRHQATQLDKLFDRYKHKMTGAILNSIKH